MFHGEAQGYPANDLDVTFLNLERFVIALGDLFAPIGLSRLLLILRKLLLTLVVGYLII